MAWLAALAGVVLFSLLALGLRAWDNDNESRLLREQTDQAGAVLSVSINQFLQPLTSVAQVAEATDGEPLLFERITSRMLSGPDALPYSAIVLVDAATHEVIAEQGRGLAITGAGGTAAIDAPEDGSVGIHDLLHIDRTLGFARASDSGRFIVYGERQLEPDPTVRGRNDGPFGRLHYGIYLVGENGSRELLGASTDDLPLDAPTATATVPYGDTEIALVMSPDGRLGASLYAHLWWIVLLAGLAGTAITAVLLGRLHASRQRALDLAELNAARHREQRDIAETLQLELLPQSVTPPPGLRMATRYWVADTASLIGGDTYDVFPIDEHRWALLVGDVCGKGIEAAALTGLVRHTVRTASQYVDSPSEVLHAVHAALAEHRPATFCTAALMFYRPDAPDDGRSGGDLTVSLGGHPPPLLRTADGTVRPIGRPGTLLGLIDPVLHDEQMRFEPGATLLAYTDGLTDGSGGRALTSDDLRASLAFASGVEAVADEIRERRAMRRAGGADDTVILVLAAEVDVDRAERSVPSRGPAAVS